MKLLDGYIYATVITGVLSMLDNIFGWEINPFYLLAPVMSYVVFVMVIYTIKNIIKTKG